MSMKLMKFYTTFGEENYNNRLDLLTNSKDLFDFYHQYLKIQPHAFLHAGFLSNFINKNRLNNKKTVSVGICNIKDNVLAHNSGLNLTVFDIDKEHVDASNNLQKYIEGNVSIVYKHNDILSGIDKNSSYPLGILCQMDYFFSDKDFKKLLQKYLDIGVEDLVILTPSLYCPLTTNAIKLLEFLGNVVNALSSYKNFRLGKQSHEYDFTYRRSINHFSNILKDKFVEISRTDYAYPTGRIYLFHYKKK